MAKKQPKLDIENGVYPDRFPGDDLPENVYIHTIDVAAEHGIEKEIISKCVILNGHQYWQARHYATGTYFTKNANDPKISRFINGGEERARGYLKFVKDGGNSLGRPRGSKNKISVQQALESVGGNPAEFLAAVMKGDVGTLKRYNIRSPKEVTVAQKLRCAETLLNKLVPNLKPVDLDGEGNPVVSKEVEESNKPQIQVYLPSTKESITIDASEEDVSEIGEKGLEGFLKDHQKETVHYDQENPEDEYVWKVDKDS